MPDPRDELEPGRTPDAPPDAIGPDQLVERVYDQLRVAARVALGRERAGHTLSPTSLVNEAYLRLAKDRRVPWDGEAHFYAAAAQAMRRILVDHARAKAAGIRGGPDARRAAIDLTALPDPDSPDEARGFLVLDEAITRLEKVDPDAAAVVRLRYFAGLSVDATASALAIANGWQVDLWDATPLRDRVAAREAAASAREIIAPLVARWFDEFGEPERVLERLDAEASLSEMQRRAARFEVFRRGLEQSQATPRP